MLHTQTSRRRQLTFCDAFIGFPAKWLLRNERRNSILMTCHYSDLASASDWLRQLYLGAQYHQIGVMTLHQRGISALDPQAAFREGTSIGRAKMSAVLFRLHENECRNFEVLLTSQSLNFFFLHFSLRGWLRVRALGFQSFVNYKRFFGSTFFLFSKVGNCNDYLQTSKPGRYRWRRGHRRVWKRRGRRWRKRGL